MSPSVASHPDLIEQVKKEIREDYDFALFCIIPGLSDRLPEILNIGKKLGIDAETLQRFSQLLLECGLWKMDAKSKKVRSNFELLDLGDITVSDYLAMTVCIISRLSDKESYEYDSLSIVTSRELIKNFVREVNQSLKNLYTQSNSGEFEKDCLFSWTHTGVIEYEKKKKAPADKENP